MYGIVYGEIVTLREAHLASWCGEGSRSKGNVGMGVVVVVREESLPQTIGVGGDYILVGNVKLRAEERLLG